MCKNCFSKEVCAHKCHWYHGRICKVCNHDRVVTLADRHQLEELRRGVPTQSQLRLMAGWLESDLGLKHKYSLE